MLLVAILAIVGLTNLAAQSISTYSEQLAQIQGVNAPQLATIMTVAMVVSADGAGLGALIAERFGVVIPLVLSMLIAACARALTGAGHSSLMFGMAITVSATAFFS